VEAPEEAEAAVVGAAATETASGGPDAPAPAADATQVFTPDTDDESPDAPDSPGGTTDSSPAATDESPDADEASPDGDSPAADAIPPAAAGAAAGAAPSPGAPAADDEADESDEHDAAVQAGNGQATPAPGIPRATPRPQPAAPLRSAPSSRTAAVPPRRPAAPAGPRRDEGGSRAARITAITLASIVAVGALVFAVTQVLGGGGDKPTPAPNVAASPNGSSSPQASADVSGQRPDTVVAVLNGTPTQGLAGASRDKLVKAGYSDASGLVRTGNNTDQQRQDSAVFFAPGQRRMARDVAQILGISAKPEAIDADTLALANNTGEGAAGHATDVVAIIGLDQSP
jgi:hypothetical protein